jgi:Fur family peroxide stress response transcriptional regulator
MNPQAVEGLLRARGLSLTGPRRAIVRFLCGNLDHPAAADVYAGVARACPGISRATVYNTLALLTELGVVRTLRGVGVETRFDPNTQPHQHRVCPVCGHLADLPNEEIAVSWRGAEVAADVRVHAPCERCA